MIKDPIVDEIRQTRIAIDRECNNDPKVYFEHIVKLQNRYKKRLVRRRPRNLTQAESVV